MRKEEEIIEKFERKYLSNCQSSGFYTIEEGADAALLLSCFLKDHGQQSRSKLSQSPSSTISLEPGCIRVNKMSVMTDPTVIFLDQLVC
jgi:hypothetical protein